MCHGQIENTFAVVQIVDWLRTGESLREQTIRFRLFWRIIRIHLNEVTTLCLLWETCYTYIYIYIYNPLYTNWPITNADLPHVIIQYILYFICQKLYWTVSGQLSNIGYIGQFQNEATGTLRTRYRRTKAVSMYLMKILSIFFHLGKILIYFRIGWFLQWIIYLILDGWPSNIDYIGLR